MLSLLKTDKSKRKEATKIVFLNQISVVSYSEWVAKQFHESTYY